MKNEKRKMVNQRLRVAIVDDWLTNLAGKERVTLELHEMFPDAPIYTSVFDPSGVGMAKFKDADIRQTFIRWLPFAKSKHQLYGVLRRWAFTRFDFSGYDLVISSSGAEAKAVRMTKSSSIHNFQFTIFNGRSMKNEKRKMKNDHRPIHINYCHSPTHYYWVRPDEYLSSKTMGWFGKLLRFGLRLLIKPMRRLDYLAAQRPDIMIANSTLTQARIKQYYDRDSQVIHPPVDVERFRLPANLPRRQGFVSLGRQVHYMRRDLAVKACTELGRLLRVIGRGPEHDYLTSLAGPSVEFYTDLNDQEVAEALWHAEALISPGVEDFGITAVEALAAGCPVIAIRGGGSKDIIEDNKTGIFFDEQSVKSLESALKTFKSSRFEAADLTAAAEKFSAVRFREKITELISGL